MDFPPEARDAVPGVMGALVAIPFTQGPLFMRLSMFVGGVGLSKWGTQPLVEWLGVTSSAGLVGFILGLFGMSVAAKVYEAIGSFAAGDIGAAMVQWAKNKMGV